MNKVTVIVVVVAVLIFFGYWISSTQGNNPKNSAGLSSKEIENLYYLREEEKLAYDVYQILGDKWEIQAFQNISNAETRHQSRVVELLKKYGLEDKSENLGVGKFNNSEIQKIYEKLVLEGNKSLLEALYVGATIEIMDIKDINSRLAETDKTDLVQVFSNLKMGSENHLSAFKNQISRFESFDENKLIKLEINNMNNTKISFTNSLVVDVRTKEEFASGNFPGSINIPLGEISGSNLDTFRNTDKENIVLVCRSGNRAGQAENILKESGISKNIVNVGPWQNLKNLDK